ncbi:LysR family transcriptional regulator [Paralcaligenes sp. KSB-10]|uniref:LysR substrate-binding domain-containing protein n=1 Tax=Paralcaligenes sp. KSB-10 TaxID=2901142 RepID=UPI001E49151B|nr:LysR family transcriptional regulator [Paralcaligenes sp. KSB-10]UHL63175.1 LysR family transcriptional regulator [Paralcaligenes sp. KSB-10]
MTSINPRLGQLRLKHLLLLNLIDEFKSISKAASALNLTQPAVSSMLKELEAVFHAGLVTRTRQGAILTDAGRTTRDRLHIALNELQAAQNANITEPNGSHLLVGALPIAMVELIPQSIAWLVKNDIHLVLKFFEGTVSSVINDVLENKLDCAIGRMDAVNFTPESIQQLCFAPLLPMFLAVACSINNPLARKKNISLETLAEHDWVVVPKGSQTRNAFDQAFIQNGIVPPVPLIESFSFFSNFHMVGATPLITLAPHLAVQRYAELKVISPVRFSWPTSISPLLFICRQEKTKLAPIQFLQQALTAAAQKIA